MLSQSSTNVVSKLVKIVAELSPQCVKVFSSFGLEDITKLSESRSIIFSKLSQSGGQKVSIYFLCGPE